MSAFQLRLLPSWVKTLALEAVTYWLVSIGEHCTRSGLTACVGAAIPGIERLA